MSPSTSTRTVPRTPQSGPTPSGGRWIAAAVVVVASLLALSAVWLLNRPTPSDTAPAQQEDAVEAPQDGAADAPQDSPAEAPQDTTAAEPAQGGAAQQPDGVAGPQPEDAPVEDGAPALLEDGRHPTYLTAMDVGGRTVTVDVIQFLTGQEAVDAYQAEFPADPAGPPNDYWIVNANPRLRTLPVAPEVTVRLVRLAEDADADLDPGTWDELPAYLSDLEPSDADRLAWNPFWIVVTDGTVTGIEEQYLP